MKIIQAFKTWWYSRKREKEVSDFMYRYGATHTCPKCEVWEHEGNHITTEYYCQATDKRTCGECGFIWRSVFCPAGHAYLDEWRWGGDKFVRGGDEGYSFERLYFDGR